MKVDLTISKALSTGLQSVCHWPLCDPCRDLPVRFGISFVILYPDFLISPLPQLYYIFCVKFIKGAPSIVFEVADILTLAENT